MRVGVIDVGSNTARLLVADVAGSEVLTVDARKTYLGLGAEIADTGTLSKETIAAAATACRRYAKQARALGAARAEVVVTSPGRQGSGAAALVESLRDRSGLTVRILSADDEGRLAFEGALARASAVELPDVVGVVDVGGGSTELVVGTPQQGPGWVRSLDLGSLRLTRFSFRDDPPGRRRVGYVRAMVREALADVQPLRPDVALAVGGSARALAKLVGTTFEPDQVDETIALLARRRSPKVARAYGLERTRARTLLAGAILLAEAARVLDRPLTLAGGGLREGAALALASGGAASAAAAA